MRLYEFTYGGAYLGGNGVIVAGNRPAAERRLAEAKLPDATIERELSLTESAVYVLFDGIH